MRGPAVVLFVGSLCTLTATAAAQTKFGTTWPTLPEILTHSEWQLGRAMPRGYVFHKDGKCMFVATSTFEFKDKFGQTHSTKGSLVFSGTWTHSHRSLNKSEKKLFGLPSRHKTPAHFLELNWKLLRVEDPKFPAGVTAPIFTTKIKLMDFERFKLKSCKMKYALNEAKSSRQKLVWYTLEDDFTRDKDILRKPSRYSLTWNAVAKDSPSRFFE